MKKIIKNPIFMFILGAIIFGSIGVAASQIFASSIKYEPSWKKSNGDSITNVAEAIDELFYKSNTYKNLNIETTATSNDILNGKTAYDNLGQLIIGSLATNCVTGSFTCTTCTSSQVVDGITFTPSRFFIYLPYTTNNEYTIWFYDSSTSSNVKYWNESGNGSYDVNTRFSLNNNLSVKNFSSFFLNKTMIFMACQ